MEIIFTVLGMTVFLQPKISELLLVLMMALQLFRESYTVLPSDTVILAILVQPLSNISALVLIPLPTCILIRLMQSANNCVPIVITESGMTTLARLLH